MSDSLIQFPSQDEKTLAAFFAEMAAYIGDTHHEILNDLARALTERGWVQPLDQVLAKWGEVTSPDKVSAALDELIHRRLVYVDKDANKFVGMLGCLSVETTPHRGHLSSGTDVFTFGGMDLLTLPSMILKNVHAFTTCAQTGVEIKLTIEEGQIVASNLSGIAGFIATWDGTTSLVAQSKNSPLFASDEALETWMKAHPEVSGTELPADLMLWVGMSAAGELGGARFKLIGHDA